MKQNTMSPMRKRYTVMLVGRCIILVLCLLVYLLHPEELDILTGNNFFDGFHALHLLWLVWVFDMLDQVFPVRKQLPLGSQKLFKLRFRPVREIIDRDAIKRQIIATTRSAYKVLLLWVVLLVAIGLLHHGGLLDDGGLFMLSVVFYVCDLICVLIWCPFRLMMKNRCCTTCRIFNWDHLMMFSPLMFVNGFYTHSLVLLALAAWLVWEICVLLYPERFWERSNAALTCAACTDKLCTQYCQKLRPKT